MDLKIYQIQMEKDEKRLKFCSLNETKQYGGEINPAIYQKVFEGNVACKNLDEVFEKFNSDIPATHSGHSLSVSDIVEADGEFYFCDNTGWEHINFDSSHVPQEKTLRILVVEPHKEPYVSTVADDYKAFQNIVSGNFECIYPDEDTVIFCNEEAKLIGMEGNRRLENDDIIAGTFLLAGDNHKGDTISLTDEQITTYTARFQEPEEFTSEEVQDTVRMEFYSL
jgi:hypothetical protein